MSEHALTDSPFGNPNGPAPVTIAEPSIIDTILDLDEFLSGDVRLAEKTARFCIRPDIEAKIDELEAQLILLVDDRGRPRQGDDADTSLSEVPAHRVLALEIQELRHQYAAAMRSVRMRQMPDDAWQAFRVEHREGIENTDAGSAQRKLMLEQLLVKTAIAPAFTVAKLTAFRSKVGSPQVDELVAVAWAVNTQSGVSVPKSLYSSAVLKQQVPVRS